MGRIFLIFFGITSLPAAVHALDVECGVAEKGVVQVDGLNDDWQGVTGTTKNGDDANDAAITVRCNHDDDTLYLIFEVGDDSVVRRAKAKGAEDTLVVTIGGDKLIVLPAFPDESLARKATWNGKGASGKSNGLELADSLQQHGFAVELALSQEKVRAWGSGVTTLTFTAEFRDADLLTEKTHHATVRIDDGRLNFAEGDAVYRQFLDDMKFKPKDIKLDVMANMDGLPGEERVIVAGRVVAVLSDRYNFMKLPVAKAKDILEYKIVDLAGEGKSAVLVRYLETGGGGTREVLGVWNLLRDGSFPMLWGHEIGKTDGKNRITNTWSLEPRKKGKKKLPGLDIVVKVGEAVGWTAETWNESPAQDMNPILLPWGEKQLEHWHFRGDESYGGE